MINVNIEKELHNQLSVLPVAQQQQVLDYARDLSTAHPRGVSGSSLIRFAGSIQHEDLQQMKAAIEADCERVDEIVWLISARYEYCHGTVCGR